jgi:hypothetical protein
MTSIRKIGRLLPVPSGVLLFPVMPRRARRHGRDVVDAVVAFRDDKHPAPDGRSGPSDAMPTPSVGMPQMASRWVVEKIKGNARTPAVLRGWAVACRS